LPEVGEQDAQEGAGGCVEDSGPYAHQGLLDSGLVAAPRADEGVDNVGALVHAHAQTHDQEYQHRCVELQTQLLDARINHQDDGRDVDGEQHHRDQVVEDQLHHPHDAR